MSRPPHLRAPEVLKCTWTWHKGHLTRKFAREIQRSRCASRILCRLARSKMHMDRSQAPNGSPDRDQHFVPACAIKMRMDMSPKLSYEEFSRKTHRPKWITLCANVGGRNAHGHVTSSTLCENFHKTRRHHGSRDRNQYFVRSWPWTYIWICNNNHFRRNRQRK